MNAGQTRTNSQAEAGAAQGDVAARRLQRPAAGPRRVDAQRLRARPALLGPLFRPRLEVGAQAVEQLRGRCAPEQEGRVLRPHEPLVDRVGEQAPEPLPVSLDVEHAHGLGVNAELGPGEHLERLFEGAEPARQRDEPIGERGHGRLALVHAPDDAQLVEPRVGELGRGERPGDDADHLATAAKHRVGEDAHEADRAAAVHEAEAALDQLNAERARRRRVRGACALRRAAEHAEALHSDAANSAVSVPV